MASDFGVAHRLERATARNWLLLAFAMWALLLWLAAVLGMGSPLRETKALAADPLPPPTPLQPARIGPLAQYADAAARPLFTQDRRPRSFVATNPEGDSPVQAQTLDFILTGVLISPQVQLAVLQPTGGGASQRVRVGKSPEGVAGWQLLRLEPRRAIFQGAGSELALDLRTFGDAGAAATQGAVATGGFPTRGADAGAAVNAAAAAASAAGAAANAAANAAGMASPSAPPQADAARIEAIRQRIEARRAQQRAARQSSGAPPPPTP